MTVRSLLAGTALTLALVASSTTASAVETLPTPDVEAARMSTATAAPSSPTKVATLTLTSSVAADGRVEIVATSNAKSVQVTHQTASGDKRRTTESVRSGQARITLAPGATSIRVRSRATSKLAASPWAAVSSEPAAELAPTPGRTYRVTPSSKILGRLAHFSSVNRYTHDYYLIRSYMQRFEAEGGGTLVLGPGRYEISSAIYVPSNTTIKLSEGTTLVKLNRTGTKKFGAASAMFMLIRPSHGKKHGAVGGHDGDADITITGAGAGRSIIDLADVRDSLAIIAGHNRRVTVSGITFQNMNNNHFIEMDGCADCTITGNEFLDAAAGTRHTAEAINLDTPDPKTHGFGSIWSNQDRTPNERVTISGNRFDGMQRALGTHNFSADRYHTDIVVTGNTITGNSDDAIHIMNWASPVFTGNIISSRPGSVGIRACGTSNPTITGNTFAESGAPVVFRTCRGENGRTHANEVTSDNVTSLRSNLAGEGLTRTSMAVPTGGSVALEGSVQPKGLPPQPTISSVVAGDRQVTVRWTSVVDDPAAPVTAFRFLVQGAAEPVILDAPADATEATITGLTNGITHVVTLAAVNGAGPSPTGVWNATPVMPQGPPSAARKVTATSPSPGSVHLKWKGPKNDGGKPLTGYRVEAFEDPEATTPLQGSPWERKADASGRKWTDLAEDSVVYLRVTAENELGEGPASDLVPVLVSAAPVEAVVDPTEDSAQGSSGWRPTTGAIERMNALKQP